MFEAQNMNNNVSCVAPYLKINDAIRKIEKGSKLRALDKNEYILIQTPQLCYFSDLLSAHNKLNDDYDDESSLLIDKGYKIKTIQGDSKCLKITYYNDLGNVL